ncbi:hypothetical protein C8P64_3055 [Christiangramia gaetbulicola]|uniref:SGNH/GDSL hydrolase family protein n=1 Tax=Christiangramia gaetbulicola TaxID=703340 RepID=A0A2T6AFN1_9FLAO|nr:hypothetical protein [Christiangramia gaetbulicola]PTX42625.1 hypothetical protein C8P64_3055 [Christiangramia gaetbulicola]
MFNPNEGYLKRKFLDVEKYKGVDIVFFGSSHSYRGFDTRIFKEYGITSFNLGSSAQTHIQTEYLMERYLKDLNPKLVIYEVYPEMFSNEGVESTINIISANENVDSEILDLLFQTRDIRAVNTFLFSFFEPRNPEIINSGNVEKDTYVPGGFVEKKLSYNTDTAVNRIWKPLPKQKAAFQENIQFLKDNNIPYLLVQAPYTFTYSNQDEIENYISENGRYYDFNHLIDFSPQKDFYDESHLNQNGVKKFNNKLIKIIDSLEILKTNKLEQLPY